VNDLEAECCGVEGLGIVEVGNGEADVINVGDV